MAARRDTFYRLVPGVLGVLLVWTLRASAQEEGDQDDKYPHDCGAVMQLKQRDGSTPSSGVYDIYPGEIKATVYCDMDTGPGGWTVIQRHRDGSADFDQTWNFYSRGFGKRDADFWLGNSIMYRLTRKTGTSYTLRIEIEKWSTPPVKKYAEYSNFQVKSEDFFYQISFANYSGTAGDSMRYQNNAYFSTEELDKDGWRGGNYAKALQSGWWFGNAVGANLNGQHYPGRWDEGRDGPYKGGIWWTTMVGFYESVRSEIKIRDDRAKPSTAS